MNCIIWNFISKYQYCSSTKLLDWTDLIISYKRVSLPRNCKHLGRNPDALTYLSTCQYYYKNHNLQMNLFKYLLTRPSTIVVGTLWIYGVVRILNSVVQYKQSSMVTSPSLGNTDRSLGKPKIHLTAGEGRHLPHCTS